MIMTMWAQAFVYKLSLLHKIQGTMCLVPKMI